MTDKPEEVYTGEVFCPLRAMLGPSFDELLHQGPSSSPEPEKVVASQFAKDIAIRNEAEANDQARAA